MLLVYLLLFTGALCQISPPWPPKVGTYDQKISHFDFVFHPLTYKQRFVYDDQWYKPGGPVFFYCGNEGDIMSFWNNTGFMFDIAPMFNALIVFVEHRYYGVSLPFGEHSFVQPQIGFLSIEEALADYAEIIPVLKTVFNASSSPVIAFGGSYGGMLAAYMRLRYPHIVEGAIAASAPFKWVTGEEELHPFFESIKEIYFAANESCIPVIQAAYIEILKRSQDGSSGLNNITKELQLCTPLESMADLNWMLRWSRNAFVIMSMMDYPYASSFMSNLPANPVNVSCAKAIEFGIQNPVAGLREAVGVLYERTSESCFDFKKQYIDCADITGCGLGNDATAWDFQACTEIHLYDPSNATSNDLFPSLPKTLEDVNSHCFKKYGVKISEKQLLTQFGPMSIWKMTSNIVFSNGNLDPWMKGGVLKDVSKSVIALQISGGAHHLDLRGANPADPPSVKIARQAEVEAISSWLAAYEKNRYDNLST
nr:Lysosomal Pro X carboxypeptidase [Hymenolepis microstoma]